MINDKEIWPKKCNSCGLSFSEKDWECLRYLGIQKSPNKLQIPDLELRNCYCNSTLSQPVLFDDYFYVKK